MLFRSGDDLLLSRAWLPDGESFGGIVTTFKSPDDGSILLPTSSGARPDREYYCVDPDIGCFDVWFDFSEPELEPYHSFSIELEGDGGTQAILTGFEQERYQTFTFCIEDGVFARMPTPSPTISLPPTGVPTTVPSLAPVPRPSLIPTPQPSPGPSVAPSLLPTPQPSLVPSMVPSMTPTAKPSRDPTPAPSRVPTAVPSPAPSLAPTFEPSLVPTPGPSAVPTIRPSPLPSPYPSVSCPLTDPPNVLIWSRWLPDGASWAGVATTQYDADGVVVRQTVGARPDREYECTACSQGCFELKFSFSAAKQGESSTMGYEIGTPTESISTNFVGGLAEESYFWCIDKCQLDRVPTNQPSVSPEIGRAHV